MFCQTEQGVALGYCLCTYLACEIVESSEKVGVDLLEKLHLTNIPTCHKVAFPQGVGLLATLSVDSVVTVGEPIEGFRGTDVGNVFCQLLYSISIKHIEEIASHPLPVNELHFMMSLFCAYRTLFNFIKDTKF